jgi:hypothetical protein
MLGAIEGLLRVHILRTVELSAISDFVLMKSMWSDAEYLDLGQDPPLDPFADARIRLWVDKAIKVIQEVTGLYLPVLGPVQSKTVKQWMWPTKLENPYEEDSWRRIHW